MTQQEFTKRTGYTPATQEEYAAIEQMYMHAGNMTKDEFCVEWMNLHDSELFRIIYCKMKTLDKVNGINEKKINTTVTDMLDYAEQTADDRFCVFAEQLVGKQLVVRYKLEKEYELSASDRAYLLSLLVVSK